MVLLFEVSGGKSQRILVSANGQYSEDSSQSNALRRGTKRRLSLSLKNRKRVGATAEVKPQLELRRFRHATSVPRRIEHDLRVNFLHIGQPRELTLNARPQPDLDQILSKVLKREVKLSALAGVRTATAEEYWPDIEGLDHRDTVTDFGLPEGTFFDCALVHLLTTATLDRLRELYPKGRFEVRRFRPNIVVETANGEKDFVENAWIGQMLAIGDAVRLSVTGPCARCVMTTLPQGDLPRDPGILRTAAQHNRANVGVYASVLQGGKVRRGDSIRLE
jgi:hypothetical protein